VGIAGDVNHPGEAEQSKREAYMADVEMRTEKAKLHRVLRRWDLALFGACAIIGLDSVAYTTAYGAGQAITWLAISIVLFLVPFGLLTAEVTAAFPAEGGLYAWSRMAFGKLPAELATMMYWLSNGIWLGGTLTAVSIGALDTFYFPKHPLGTAASIIVGLIFTWVCIGLSVISLKYGKWSGNVGTAVKTAAMVIFVGLVIAFLAKHGLPKGIAPASSYAPSVSGFLAIIGVIVFLWVGFELQGSASEEMVNPQKDVPKAILSSGLISGVIYIAIMGGILLLVTQKDLTAASGLSDAAQIALTSVAGGAAKGLGYVVGAIMILTYVFSAAVWTLGSARVQAVAALDGSAPRWLGKFSKQGTPVPMAILMGLVGSVFCILIFLVTSGSLKSFIGVMIALDTSLTVVVYVFLIPAIVRLRTSHPHVHRPFIVPGGKIGLWTCAVITTFLSVVTCITLLWPGLINNILGQSYSITANWGMSRVRFEVFTLGSFVILLLLGVVFWAIGRRQMGETSEDALIEGVVEET
jgi:amino acid transporter